jgi:hypothetical protein
MATIRVPFGSEEYFALAASSRAVADALTVGPSVVLVHDGTAYQVIASKEEGDPLPVTTTLGTEMAAAPASSGGGGGFPVLPIAAAAAFVAVAVLMRTVVKRGH